MRPSHVIENLFDDPLLRIREIKIENAAQFRKNGFIYIKSDADFLAVFSALQRQRQLHR